MKKVLAIAPYPYLPYYSGGQKFIALFFEQLAKITRLTVASVPGNEAPPSGAYTLLPLLKRSFFRYMDPGLMKKISALVQQEQFDTIIWEHPYFGWLAKKLQKRTGIKTIIHTHNIEYQRFRSMGKWWWPFLQWYERRCLQLADAVFFITPEDKNFATKTWGIPESKCVELPFGIEMPSYPTDRDESKKYIAALHGFSDSDTVLSFNGLLNYQPNLDALQVILDKINPLLLQQDSFRYKIIVSGKNLPEKFGQLSGYAGKNIIFTGFTNEITSYLKATDIFLNPVISGGGIKTKIVEAIACGATVLSAKSGARGIAQEVCGKKLVVLPDSDWQAFANAILNMAGSAQTPEAFYRHYHWGAIMERIKEEV